ncbi:MAG: hypothetical protein Q4P06_03430 [Actinomycetaceae bacterium]|nr:hypothetical protein [Actinomycetaceae bacterium]
MSISWPTNVDLLDVIGPWLYQQRWFPGSEGDAVRLVANLDLTAFSVPPRSASAPAQAPAHRVSAESEFSPSPSDPASESGAEHPHMEPVWISFVEVGDTLLQLPLAYREFAPETGVIAQVEDGWLVDGPNDELFLRTWLRYALSQGAISPLQPEAATGLAQRLDRQISDAHSLGAEQSNTSVLLPGKQPCVVKFIRVLHPGTHPEVEMAVALGEQGWPHVPTPLVALETTLPDSGWGNTPVALSVASEFISNARDGFELCVERARQGDDFCHQASSLGGTIRSLHETLGKAFAPAVSDTEVSQRAQALAARIHANFAAAAAEVPQLRDFEGSETLEATIDQVASLPVLPQAIRIHGDLHLGQTLERDDHWWVLDFEGEPLRPLSQRREPDLALRDVAGMLRSFDYAAAKAGMDESWLHRVREAFLSGYCLGQELSAEQRVLLRALEIEKAAYEAVYEHRLRPQWVSIPLRALSKLAGQ